MPLVSRLLLCFCVFAGMASGMVHTTTHDSHDDCAHAHSHDHHDHHDHEGSGDPSQPEDASDHPDTHHHHDCCHYPAADRPSLAITMPCSFLTDLVEISTDRSLVPDEPLFLLDKPPLI